MGKKNGELDDLCRIQAPARLQNILSEQRMIVQNTTTL